MLQTIQAKADATSQLLQAKDKDVPSEDLPEGISTFLSQYMAAMPQVPGQMGTGIQPAATPVPAPNPNSAPPDTTRQTGDPTHSDTQAHSKADQAAAGQRTAGVAAAVAAAAAAAAAIQGTSPDDPAPPTDPAISDAQADPKALPAVKGLPLPAGLTQVMATALSASPHPGDKDLESPEDPANAPSPAQGTASNPVPGSATAAKATTPDGISALKAQADLQQILPGGKVQFQFGDLGAQPTTKPALSEFLNQPKLDIQTPSFTGVGSNSGDVLPQTAAAQPEALPQGIPNLMTPQAAILPQGVGQPLPREATPAAPAVTGNFSPSEAVGAAAAPGAAGSVRVTASAEAPSSTLTRRENPMTQVDTSIRWLIKNKDQSAELQLHPESLGRLQIKITVEGNQVHAKLWASDPAAVPILQDQRALLETSLKAQGLTLGSFDLQQGHQSDQNPLPAPPPPLAFQPSLSPVQPDVGQETPSARSPGISGTHRIEIVA